MQACMCAIHSCAASDGGWIVLVTHASYDWAFSAARKYVRSWQCVAKQNSWSLCATSRSTRLSEDERVHPSASATHTSERSGTVPLLSHGVASVSQYSSDSVPSSALLLSTNSRRRQRFTDTPSALLRGGDLIYKTRQTPPTAIPRFGAPNRPLMQDLNRTPLHQVALQQHVGVPRPLHLFGAAAQMCQSAGTFVHATHFSAFRWCRSAAPPRALGLRNHAFGGAACVRCAGGALRCRLCGRSRIDRRACCHQHVRRCTAGAGCACSPVPSFYNCLLKLEMCGAALPPKRAAEGRIPRRMWPHACNAERRADHAASCVFRNIRRAGS